MCNNMYTLAHITIHNNMEHFKFVCNRFTLSQKKYYTFTDVLFFYTFYIT